MKKMILVLVFVFLLSSVQGCYSVGPHYMTLNWSPSSDGAANPTLGYNVYRSTTPGGEGSTPINSAPVAVGCSAVCTYQDNGVGLGTYSYVVKAVINGAESVKSNEGYGTIVPSPPTGVIVIPN
jgi:hypothetical protein